MAYNVNLTQPQMPSGQPPPPPPAPGANHGQVAASYMAHGSGDNAFPGYQSGYAGYTPTANYPTQWGDNSQVQGQAATYDLTAYQNYNYGNQAYAYGNQGYSYGNQVYGNQDYNTAGQDATWDPSKNAWNNVTSAAGDQTSFGQTTTGVYGSSQGGYNNSGGGRGIARGRGDTSGGHSGGDTQRGGFGTSRGRGLGNQGQDFRSDSASDRGRGSAAGRGSGGGASWQSGGQASSGDVSRGGMRAQGRGRGFRDQESGGESAFGSSGGSNFGSGGGSNFGSGGGSNFGSGGGSNYGSGGGSNFGSGGGSNFGSSGGSNFGSAGGFKVGSGGGSNFGSSGGSNFGSSGGSNFGSSGGSKVGLGGGSNFRSGGGSNFGSGGGSNFGSGGFSSRGRGNSDNRGRGMSDRGRGFSDRGRGFSDRGRGFSDRGRGFSDRGRGVSDRGRGISDRGRGTSSSDRGRGAPGRGRGFGDRGGLGRGDQGQGFGGRGRGMSDRGRGGGDRGQGMSFRSRGGGPSDRGRGRGSGRGGGSDHGGFNSHETIFTSSSGVGLSSLGDVIKSAKSRQFSNVQPCVATDSLTKLVEHWKEFTRTFTDCGNAITTMECSLTASKVRFLQLHYTSRPLTQINHYCFFTGSLFLNKVTDQRVEDSIFLARGLGLTKKNAKLDAYQKSYNLVMNSTVAEIMSQEDTNDNALIEEVTCLFNEDPSGFMALLRKSNIEEGEGTQAMVDASRKRTPSSTGPNIPPKRPRIMSDKVAGMLEMSSTSLVPKKQVDLVMDPKSSLFDKLTKLKQLLKEEGITKLHIVPKIDQLGAKSALAIRNVYRFLHPPYPGTESETPVFCEIYFDNVFISRGEPNEKHPAAMHDAYTLLAERLCKESLDSIVHCSSYWQDYMKNDPDVSHVTVKRAGEDNDSLLVSNLANMKQMMQTTPDFSIPIDRFVIMEFEADMKMENTYKRLELSATRNCMLLECELVRAAEQRFTCIVSMQGRQLCIRSAMNKIGAKRCCSDAIIAKLSKTNDIVYIGKDIQGLILTRAGLVEDAKKAKAAGVEPLKCCLQKADLKIPNFKNLEEANRWQEDREKAREFDNLLENLADRPYIPWMGKILAENILKYHKEVSLVDLRVHLNDMPKSMRDMVQIVSSKMGLRTVSKVREGEYAILRRTIPAMEVTKILGLHDGESGRFKMKQCKHPWSAKELQEYKEEITAKYTKMYEDLLSEIDTETDTNTASQINK